MSVITYYNDRLIGLLASRLSSLITTHALWPQNIYTKALWPKISWLTSLYVHLQLGFGLGVLQGIDVCGYGFSYSTHLFIHLIMPMSSSMRLKQIVVHGFHQMVGCFLSNILPMTTLLETFSMMIWTTISTYTSSNTISKR
jgi:hypothetical protein